MNLLTGQNTKIDSEISNIKSRSIEGQKDSNFHYFNQRSAVKFPFASELKLPKEELIPIKKTNTSRTKILGHTSPTKKAENAARMPISARSKKNLAQLRNSMGKG